MADIFKKINSIEPADKPGRPTLELITSPPEPITERKRTHIRPVDIIESENSSTETSDRRYVRNEDVGAPSTRWMGLMSVTAIMLWLAISTLVILTFFDLPRKVGDITGLELSGIALFVFGPLFLILVTIYACRQLSQLSMQVARMEHATQALMSPDDTAARRTTAMTRKIRNELDNVGRRSDALVSRLADLQDTLETQVKKIGKTTYLAETRTETIASRLTAERLALDEIAKTFSTQMDAMSKLLDENSAKLSKATQEAEIRMQEARVSVEGVATKISETSQTVHANTVEASQTLTENHKEITALAQNLNSRSQELDVIYASHANDLNEIISTLKGEQESMNEALESRLNKMRDMSLSAQVSAQHMIDASEAGRETIESLSNAARLTDSAVKQRFSEMENMVRYSNARAESISEKAARRVQESLSQTRKEISRIENDMVELQDRLNSATNAQSSNEKAAFDAKSVAETDMLELSEIAEPPKPVAPPQKKQKTYTKKLKVRPVTEEIEPTKPVQIERNDPSTQTSSRQSHGLTGLRPAPEAEVETFEIPASPQQDLNTTLDLEIPAIEDLLAPDPDKEIKAFDPNIGRSAPPSDVPSLETDLKRQKIIDDRQDDAPWWRRIFSADTSSETSAIDALTQKNDETRTAKPSNVVERLTALNLTPSAIVDDGCIIEAVNTRKSSGPLAMSDVIIHRLGAPVSHLRSALNADAELKERITEFAREFHGNLGSIEDDREEIRSRFESDEGRAFLLCDAALNM